jgi:hypothetical protein
MATAIQGLLAFVSFVKVPGMLVPLTRKTFETLIPAVATGAQYGYCWGKLKDLLRRVLISVVGMFGVLILYLVLGSSFAEVFLVAGIAIGLFWLWEPALRASQKNWDYRRYAYAGFWQGTVMELFVSEELVGTEETVNKRGDLVIVENRERCLNLEVGDRSGFSVQLQVPLKRAHRALDVGDSVEMLVFSNRSDLSRIVQNSDVYIPDHNLWVSDYPYIQRDVFLEVRRRVDLPELEPPDSEVRRSRSPRTSPLRDRSQSRFAAPDEFDPRDEGTAHQPTKRVPREERLRREQELERLEQRRASRQDNLGNRQPKRPESFNQDDDRNYPDRDYPVGDRPRRKRTPRYP